MNNKAIIMLSGGLDSLVSTAIAHENYDIVKALHFDYKQFPAVKEDIASQKIATYYGIDLEFISLNWLGDLSKDSLLAQGNESKKDKDIGVSYWIPNRNGVFANIAASYAEALDCKYIIIGANLEEAQGFKDNSIDFINAANELFKLSTQNNVEIIAPLINMTKNEIIEEAIRLKAPLEHVWSCYKSGEKHCGGCPSCLLLKSGLTGNSCQDLLNLLF